MGQINFLIIFTVCLAVVLFSLQNTEPTVIKLLPEVQVRAPLAIELLIAMGLGAVIAWIFSIWTRLLQQLGSFKAKLQLRSKDKHIEQLEQDIERYKLEIAEQQLPALSASKTLTEGE